jgi:hypothetical protein
MFRKPKRLTNIAIVAICFSVALISAFISWSSRSYDSPALVFDYKEKLYGFEPTAGFGTAWEIDQSVKATDIQLFYDIGVGFNPDDVSTNRPLQTNRWKQIRMELPEIGVRKIRLDPARTAGEFWFREFRIVDALGDVRLTIPLRNIRASNQIASMEESDGKLRVITFVDAQDPSLQVVIKNELDLRLGSDQQLQLFGEILLWWCVFWAALFIIFFVIYLILQWLITIQLVLLVTVAALFFGISIAGIASYLENQPDVIDERLFALQNYCASRSNICPALTIPLRTFRFALRRTAFSKSELPILNIYITDGRLSQIKQLRARTLNAVRPIYFSKDQDWVKGLVVFDDGKVKIKKKVFLRLKGRIAGDHWGHPRKHSMRIKVRNGGSIMGMTKFSMQSASQRSYQYEPLMLNMMRRLGVIAPRYVFVDARINDQVVGIMALEEHFTKEMLEYGRRREGPVVAVDMNWMWEQADQNYNNNGSRDRSTNLLAWDYPVKSYQSRNFAHYTARGVNTVRAMSLFRDYRNGEIFGSDAFDLDVLSRWWIIVNIWQTWHSLEDSNRRHYFNPITSRLEPIAYDGSSWLGLNRQWRLLIGDDVKSVLTNPTFKELTFKNIQIISTMLGSSEFRNWLIDRQSWYIDLISIDGSIAPPISIQQLERSLHEFAAEVDKVFIETESVGVVEGGRDKRGLRRSDDDPIHMGQFQKNDNLLVRHVRPFWFLSEDSVSIEIKNLTLYPIIVSSIFSSKRPEMNMLKENARIPVFLEKSEDHIFRLSLTNIPRLSPNDEVVVEYWYRDKKYTKPVFHQFRNYLSGYSQEEATNSWFEQNNVTIDPIRQQLTFPAGNYILNERMETQPGWTVKFLPGVRLEFRSGGTLKINGPLLALGSPTRPVTLVVSSTADRGALGTWGGILVVNSGEQSVLQHTHVIGTPNQSLPNSQDSHGLTGCVTFYNSRVRIIDSLFSNLQCEDALNIINSGFEISNTKFVDARSDAFDSDFSNGTVVGSSFRRVGGDGIDLAGSNVEVRGTQLAHIGDKAFSVGEKSFVEINQSVINYARIGVASKDQSIATIKNSDFNNILGSTLMTYVKKEEYGPSELHCIDCRFDVGKPDFSEQFGSRITIDGEEIITTVFNRAQLRSAGYIQ